GGLRYLPTVLQGRGHSETGRSGSVEGRRVDLFYQILGVPRGASQEEVRAAYRARAKFYHPDKLDANAPAALRAECEARIKEVNAANDVLSDPVKRAAYDAAPAEDGVNLLDLAA